MEHFTDIIVILIVAVIIGAICFYLWRQKKKGVKCIGCPYSKECSGKCGCHNGEENNESKTAGSNRAGSFCVTAMKLCISANITNHFPLDYSVTLCYNSIIKKRKQSS